MKSISGYSQCFTGKKGYLKRYLVCSLGGFFPVLVKTGANALSVVYRVGGIHISPFGTLAVSHSVDGGESWSDPIEVNSRWEDTRNPAFGVNQQGDLFLAYWKAEKHYLGDPANIEFDWYNDKDSDKKDLFITCSCDQGKTWQVTTEYTSDLYSASFYGRIITLPDGTMIMCFYGIPKGSKEGQPVVTRIVRSYDGGMTWGDETQVAEGYNETAYAAIDENTIVAAMRSNDGSRETTRVGPSRGAFIATSISKDKGRTWSKPERLTEDNEHPADLTLLQSGKLLLTFGRRVRPYGAGCLVSHDGGVTWDKDHEVLLAGDGVGNVDLGYPSTVQLDNGKIVTALYYSSGSEMSHSEMGESFCYGWGTVSCQAIHYYEEDHWVMSQNTS